MARKPARKKPHALVRLDSKLTYEDLEGIERAEQRLAKPWPRKLPLKRIEVAPLVFQLRLSERDDPEADQDADVRQVWDLVRALAVEEKPLDPLLVTAIGQRVFVVNGHHRLDAYHSAGWTTAVPVEWFPDDLYAARNAAMETNRKNTLRMTEASRVQQAWTLMKERTTHPERKATWETIRQITGVSKGTLSNMHRSLQTHGDKALGTALWSEARKLDWPQFTRDEDAVNEWLDKDAQKKLDHLMAGPSLGKNVESTAMALDQLGLRHALLEQWSWYAMEHVVRRVREEHGDEEAHYIEQLFLAKLAL
jgi:hypothetical protein